MSSFDSVLPEPYKTDPDENGIFTYVYFKLNSLGEMVKVTQKKKLIKETRRVSKAVYERRKKLESNKFGNAKNSCNTNVTTEEKQDIYIITPDQFNKEDSKHIIGNMDTSYKLFQRKQLERKMLSHHSMDKKPSNIYVEKDEIKYNYYSIRINNLSSNTKEQDIADLCSIFGNIKRVFLAINRQTGRSKGYAFVSFYNKDDAKSAIQSLNGYGYDNLILQVEYSIERSNKN